MSDEAAQPPEQSQEPSDHHSKESFSAQEDEEQVEEERTSQDLEEPSDHSSDQFTLEADSSESESSVMLCDHVPVPKSRPTGRRHRHHRSRGGGGHGSSYNWQDSMASLALHDSNDSFTKASANAVASLHQSYSNSLLFSFSNLSNDSADGPSQGTTSTSSTARRMPGSSAAAKRRSRLPPHSNLHDSCLSVSLHDSGIADHSQTSLMGSRISLASSQSSLVRAAAAAAQTDKAYKKGEAAERPSMKNQRQDSWYQDLLDQVNGGSSQLEAFLNNTMTTTEPATELIDKDGPVAASDTAEPSSSAPQDHHPEDSSTPQDAGFDDAEVLEQYRIMAHHEARQRAEQRLKGNKSIAQLREDAHERQKRQQEARERKEQIKCIPLPPMVRPKRNVAEICKPTLPKAVTCTKQPRPPRRLAQPKELCLGSIVEQGDDGATERGELVTISCCMGCHVRLQTPATALLVQCPECRTVGPASVTSAAARQ